MVFRMARVFRMFKGAAGVGLDEQGGVVRKSKVRVMRRVEELRVLIRQETAVQIRSPAVTRHRRAVLAG